MTDHANSNDEKPRDDKAKAEKAAPAPTLSSAPERELELKLKKNPDSKDAQVDVGSDESMDASDPVAATAPGGNDPVPSSGFPKGR